jgi:hypothetical protein
MVLYLWTKISEEGQDFCLHTPIPLLVFLLSALQVEALPISTIRGVGLDPMLMTASEAWSSTLILVLLFSCTNGCSILVYSGTFVHTICTWLLIFRYGEQFCPQYSYRLFVHCPGAEFLNVIGTHVPRVFLFAIHSYLC